ncbi:DUF2079 domain-containing protein [Leptospira sp. WS39.C2]
MKQLWKYLPSLLLWMIVFYYLSERSIFRYHHLGAGVDIGLFENILYNIIHNGKAYTSLGLDGNFHHYFADHINWFVYPISLIYYLFDNIESLLIFQAFVLSLPIVILPTLGKLKSYYIIYPTLYALFLPIYWIQIFDFHPEVLWIPLFFLFYYFWQKQSRYWILFFLLSLMTKEETSFVWIVFSFLNRKTHPKESLFIVIISSLYLILSIGLLSYFYKESNSVLPAHLERYKDPWTAINNFHLFPYLILFLTIPFLFLPFRNSLVLCLLPYFFYSLFSLYEVNKTPFTHHSFIAIPILILSYIEVVEKQFSNQKKLIYSLSLLISILCFLNFGPISKSYSYRKEYLNRSITNNDYLILKELLPNQSIVSNIPQYLSNRNKIQLHLPNQKFTSDYYIYYQWKEGNTLPTPPEGYEFQKLIQNNIHIFKRKKID